MNKNKLLGLVGLVSSAFVGGAILPSLIRWGTELVHPFLLNWFRIFIGLIILLLIFKGKYNLKRIFDKKYLPFGLILGLGLGLNVTMFSFGISHTTLIASQLIYVLTPVVTSLMAFLLLKEKTTSKKISGMVLAFIGVLILIIFSRSPEEKLSLGTFYGNFLIFIGMFGYSTYLIFSKKLTSAFSIIEMIIISNIFLSVLLLPFAGYAIYQQGWSQINLQSMVPMTLMAIGALVFMALGQMSIKHLSASSASLSSLLSPEFAALAGIIIYNEKLSLILIISMILSIGGTILSIRSEKVTLLDRIKLSLSKLQTIKGIK